jgi:hypothetical protein
LVLQGSLTLPSNLPCNPGDCYVNVDAWANHSNATAGDKILIGANNGNHGVDQGRARDGVVRYSPSTTIDELDSLGLAEQYNVNAGDRVNTDLPFNGDDEVIYSQPIHDPTKQGDPNLRQQEQLEVHATVEAENNNNIVLAWGLELVVGDSKNDTTGSGAFVDEKVIAEHNGQNCNPGAVCTREKVGVTKVDSDADRTQFINVVADSGTPFNSGNGNGQQLHIRQPNQVALHVNRFFAGVKG